MITRSRDLRLSPITGRKLEAAASQRRHRNQTATAAEELATQAHCKPAELAAAVITACLISSPLDKANPPPQPPVSAQEEDSYTGHPLTNGLSRDQHLVHLQLLLEAHVRHDRYVRHDRRTK
ncbi:hypothetical protein MRX96_049408 [Rhipicephalus microplus]